MRPGICSAGYWALCCVVALGVFTMFLRGGGIDIPRATVPDMVHGRAHRPFVQRVLIPLLARAAVSASPARVKAQATRGARETRVVRAVFARAGWDDAYALEYLVVLAIMFAALLGFVWSIRSLVAELYSTDPWVPGLGGVLALVCLPPFISKAYYSAIYDFSTLLLFSLGLLLILRQRWLLYMVVFVAASLNKETAILLTLVFAVRCYRPLHDAGQARLFRLLALSQAAVYAATRGAIAWVFRANPGSSLEFHLRENLDLYLNAYSLPWLLSGAAVLVVVVRHWRAKPVLLRQASWVLVPLLGSMPVMGWFYEFRACYEGYPVVLLLALPTLMEMLGAPISTRNAEGMDGEVVGPGTAGCCGHTLWPERTGGPYRG